MEDETRRKLDAVLDYWLEDVSDSNRPTEIVLAMCQLWWPDRTFEVVAGADDEGMIYLADVVDAETGEDAYDLHCAKQHERKAEAERDKAEKANRPRLVRRKAKA